jgi:integrase/recombinase XerD
MGSGEVAEVVVTSLFVYRANAESCSENLWSRRMSETTQLIEHYLRLERPDPCSAALFVVLKGSARGQPMTPAGLRSLFRHHRRSTGIQLANPHRFRHTFASDMVRAGISLPALMQLMGHADIQTTLHYVKVSPQDVYLQYARAAAQCIHPQPRISA